MEKKWNKKLVEKEKINVVSTPKGNNLWSGMKKTTNLTRTENDALTYKSTQSKILDLFSMGGALRTRDTEEIKKMVSQALAEDFILGTKCLFYIRDIRGGLGERRTFREGIKVLSEHHPKKTKDLLKLIPEYGRWDDLLSLEGINIKEVIKNQIEEDLKSENPSLLGKWLPSENAGNKSKILARALRKYLGINSKQYRKTLVELRKKIDIVETKMSNKKWDKIDYSKIPSKASIQYREAFKKNDEKRYEEYLDRLEKGETKINTKTLFPYEIVRQARVKNNKTLELAWKNLPDYTKENEKALVVADVSGSMNGHPMDVSVSLAMYFAERNKGVFHNKFITFSERPELQEVKGSNLSQKILNLEDAHWNMNTNIQAVFDLILNTAIENSIKGEDMPKTIYIISDMEFDYCATNATNFEVIKEKYGEAGYEMPQLVFWNVDSRQNNIPVTENEEGVVLVSGSSPNIFKMVCEKTTPIEFMNKVLNSERYKPIEDILNGM